MKIDTPEKYKAKYDRIGRKKAKKVRLSDKLGSIAAKEGVIFVEPVNEAYARWTVLPGQIGYGSKPEHHKRAMDIRECFPLLTPKVSLVGGRFARR